MSSSIVAASSDFGLECCTICTDPLITGLCSLPDCPHVFHFQCLKTFYQIKESNRVCPLCRAPFTKVLVDGEWVRAETTRRAVEDEEEDDEAFEEYDEEEESSLGERCFVCGGYGEVLICDGCDRLCHEHCAGLSAVRKYIYI